MGWRAEFERELVEWGEGDPGSWSDVVEYANGLDALLCAREGEASTPEGRAHVRALRRTGYALAGQLAKRSGRGDGACC